MNDDDDDDSNNSNDNSTVYAKRVVRMTTDNIRWRMAIVTGKINNMLFDFPIIGSCVKHRLLI